MSFYMDKMVEKSFDFQESNFDDINNINNDITVFFELDPLNYPNIYVWGIKTKHFSEIRLCLFNNLLKKVIYQFTDGYDVCLINDLKLKKNFDAQGKSYHDYHSNIGSRTINKYKLYIYNNKTQLFTLVEKYDDNKKWKMINYEINNQNNIFSLVKKTESDLLNENNTISIINIMKLPELNILCLTFRVNTKSYQTLILLNLDTGVVSYKTNSVKQIKSIFLNSYIIFQCNDSINTIYDYQNNKEILRVEGVIRNKNEMYNIRCHHNHTILDDESVIVVYSKNKQEVYKFKDIDELPDDKKCVVCFGLTERTSVIVPCGHTQFCGSCITKFNECPICRKDVSSVIKIY